MRSASFHFAMRSERAKEPTLSWPAPQPTARCTIVTSSVSPERAETIAPQPPSRAASSAAFASVTVPAWFGLTSTALQMPAAAAARPAPRGDQEIVADDLHPVGRLPRKAAQPLGVVLGQRVLDRHDRIAVEPAEQRLGHAVGVEGLAVERQAVAAIAVKLGGGDVERDRDLLARGEAGPLDRPSNASSAASLLSKAGQKPPSSATPCNRPRSAMISPAARYTSAVHSSAWSKSALPAPRS